MEQQHFRVRISLGTKLLFGLVLLFLVAIGFLSVSAILLIVDDKKAYTYQSQATEAALVSSEFTSRVRQATDLLRIYLGNIDPAKPLTSLQQDALRTIVENQSEVDCVKAVKFQHRSLTTTTVSNHARSKGSLDCADLEISSEQWKSLSTSLEKVGFSVLSLSKLGSPPLLGVFLADLKLWNDPAGTPVGVAITSLQQLAEQVVGADLAIVDELGVLLFANDTAQQIQGFSYAGDALFEFAKSNSARSGTREFESAGTEYLGSYIKTPTGAYVLIRTEFRQAIRAAYELAEQFLWLGLMVIGGAIVFGVLFSHRVIAPIRKLFEATQEVSSGHFDLKLQATSRDEIGVLTHSFVGMSHQIRDLLKESVQKAQLEGELKIASAVQASLFPPPISQDEETTILTHYESASECGGDWVGHFRVGNQVCIMIADATGHGVSSALVTASARSCFSVLQRLAESRSHYRLRPKELMSYANRVIYDSASTRILMTFFVGVLDLETGVLQYSNAAHNPPWVLRQNGGRYEFQSLVATGPRLGEVSEISDFEEVLLKLQPEDHVFLYTDGLMEGRNRDGVELGKKRIRKLIQEGIPHGPIKVMDHLVKVYQAHHEGKSLDDDVTLLWLHFRSSVGQKLEEGLREPPKQVIDVEEGEDEVRELN
jgi:serine phosphatase RsbU (regulator of sigma subunit)